MLTDYLHAALKQTHHEILPDDGSFHGEIPGFQGLWANAETLGACRAELREVLKEWVLLGVATHEAWPIADGLELAVKKVA